MDLLYLRVKTLGQGTDAHHLETYVDFQSLHDSPGKLIKEVQALARRLLPVARQVKTTYQDDEGDACTLTEDTVPDALAFATLSDDNIRLLEVCACPQDTPFIAQQAALEECDMDGTAAKAAFLEVRNRPLPDLHDPDVQMEILLGNEYTEIVPRLFLAGDYEPQKVAYLNGTIESTAPNIGFVVQCSENPSKCGKASNVPRFVFEPQEDSEGGMCVGIHCFDLEVKNDLGKLKDCCIQIKTKLEQQCNVLVHCQQGVDRSPTVLAAFCMAYFDISTTDVRESLKRLRPACTEQVPGHEDMLRTNERVIRRFFDMIGEPPSTIPSATSHAEIYDGVAPTSDILEEPVFTHPAEAGQDKATARVEFDDGVASEAHTSDEAALSQLAEVEQDRAAASTEFDSGVASEAHKKDEIILTQLTELKPDTATARADLCGCLESRAQAPEEAGYTQVAEAGQDKAESSTSHSSHQPVTQFHTQQPMQEQLQRVPLVVRTFRRPFGFDEAERLRQQAVQIDDRWCHPKLEADARKHAEEEARHEAHKQAEQCKAWQSLLADAQSQTTSAIEKATAAEEDLHRARLREATAQEQIKSLQDHEIEMTMTMKACKDAEDHWRAEAQEQAQKCNTLESELLLVQAQKASTNEETAAQIQAMTQACDSAVEKARAETVEQLEKCNTVESLLAEANKQLADAIERAGSAEEEMHRGRFRESAAQERIQALQESNNHTEAMFSTCRAAEEQARAEGYEQSEKCKALESELMGMQARMGSAIENAAAVQQELRQELISKQAEIETLKSSAASLMEATAGAQEQISEATQRARVAEASVEKLSGELVQAKQHAEISDKRALNSERALRRLQEERKCRPGLAAVAVCGESLVMGVEAEEDEAARRDVTADRASLLGAVGVHQVFCVGRARMVAGSGIEAGTGKPLGPVPVSARVHIKNNGVERWPQTVVLAISGGDSMGLPVVPVPSLNPGETAEVAMDLSVPRRLEATETSSTWTVLDAASGAPLGPLLTFEVQWTGD